MTSRQSLLEIIWENPARRFFLVGFLFSLAMWLLSGQAFSHDWYDELDAPDGRRCCGDKDCAPYLHRSTPGNIGYELFVLGKWWPVPPEAIVGMFSPDGLAHACCFYGHGQTGCEAREPVVFRCVILPGQGV